MIENKIKKVMSYFIWIPFAVAIGAFVLYFRYLLAVKLSVNTAVTSQVTLVMDRYLKIGLFSLFIGLLCLLVNKISKLVFNEDKYYSETYPWMNNEVEVEEKEEKPKTLLEETIKAIEPVKQEETKPEYIIKENIISDDNISKAIKSNKVLKARFINNNEERMIEILTDEEEEEAEILSLDNVVVMPEIKRETVIKVDSTKVNVDGYKKCPKCGNLVLDEAVVCVNCGILLDESLRGKISGFNRADNEAKTKEEVITKKRGLIKFNPVKFAINAIIIILGFIGIILLCNKIENQKSINDTNLNMQNNIESIN